MDQAAEASIASLMFVGIVGMLLLAFAVILFFLLYQRKMLAQQDQLREMEIAHQRESLETIIQAQEEERKRIAQDLHDGIGALLSATKLYVNRLPEKESDKKQDIGFIKNESIGLIDETIDNIRIITRNLLPTSLERFGLLAAVEDLSKRINSIGNLQIDFQSNQDVRFDGQQEVNLYRIIQELTNNTLKYAAATLVEIKINIHEDQLQLIYSDNGKGFEMPESQSAIKMEKGLGLRGIQTRSEVLNADLKINAAPDKGIFVSLKMKLNPAQP